MSQTRRPSVVVVPLDTWDLAVVDLLVDAAVRTDEAIDALTATDGSGCPLLVLVVEEEVDD